MKAGDGRETHTIDMLQFAEVHDNSMPLYQPRFNSFAERIGVLAKHKPTGTTKHGHVIRDVTGHVQRHAFDSRWSIKYSLIRFLRTPIREGSRERRKGQRAKAGRVVFRRFGY